MKYSIEIGKIVEGAMRRDQLKVMNYTGLLADKLEQDGDVRSAKKFRNLLSAQKEMSLTAMSIKQQHNIPVDSESRANLADIIYPGDNDIRVIFSKSNEEKIDSFILSYKNADKLSDFGIDVPNTLLLYGPPGCGKTKCAYLIAKKLNLPLVIARIDSIISSYLGTTAKNIRSLFEYVQRMPCVLFLDEFDAIAKARDDHNEMGELKRVVNSLLQNVDELGSDSLMLAATNHHMLLDPAVWRRFDYKLEIELPDDNVIIELIKLFTKGIFDYTEKDLKELACLFHGLSGAEIEEIITKSMRKAVLYDQPFNKAYIYEEFFSAKNLIPQDCLDSHTILRMKAIFLRKCNKKLFSLQVIADVLGSSKTTIQKIVKEGMDDGE